MTTNCNSTTVQLHIIHYLAKCKRPADEKELRCVRCLNENRMKRKRLRWQAANHGCHCFDRLFLRFSFTQRTQRRRLRLTVNRVRLMFSISTDCRKWLSHKLSCRLPLLSARRVVTFPSTQHHCHYKLYCLVIKAQVESHYMEVEHPATSQTTPLHQCLRIRSESECKCLTCNQKLTGSQFSLGLMEKLKNKAIEQSSIRKGSPVEVQWEQWQSIVCL